MRHTPHLKKILMGIALLCISTGALAHRTANWGRMDRSKLNIGTYYLQPYAQTEAHVRDLKACGIDFIIGIQNEKKILDILQKYEVGAVVGGVLPGWWGGDGGNAGQMKDQNPLSKYEEIAKSFTDHPAAWGIDIGDEPSALDFPHYGKVYEKVSELFPNQFPYLNLYPNYASVSQNNAEQTVNQLGTPTYEEHIAEYCKNVPADYLCYDFYLYSVNVPRAYENLRVVADACTGSGRSMWIVLQVNSDKEEEWITENGLRFQAYTAMAYGAEVITWACYTAGWWHNQVLDEKGNKTQQYEKLKRVNKEIRLLAEPYMKYRRTDTQLIGFQHSGWNENVRQQNQTELNNKVFTKVHMEDCSPLVAGEMVSRAGDGAEALFVCSADDPYDKTRRSHKLRFRAEGREITVTGTKGNIPVQEDEDGFYSFNLPSNQAALIEAHYKY